MAEHTNTKRTFRRLILILKGENGSTKVSLHHVDRETLLSNPAFEPLVRMYERTIPVTEEEALAELERIDEQARPLKDDNKGTFAASEE